MFHGWLKTELAQAGTEGTRSLARSAIATTATGAAADVALFLVILLFSSMLCGGPR
jgi:hypothetical protein